MKRRVHLQKYLLAFGLPLSLIGITVFMAKIDVLAIHPKNLSFGITFDLLLTIPIVYFLLIRNTNIPKTTVVAFLILGMLIGSIVIPNENQYYLNIFKTWVFPIIELAILSYVIYKVKKLTRQFKLHKNKSFDFFTALKKTCYEILPKSVANLIAMELAVFYYGFIYWRKRKLKSNEFSYHKDSGTITLLIALLFIVAIETFVLHNLLLEFSKIAAWVLSFLSIYCGFQLVGFLKSMYKRPISIENNKLFLRYGIMNESTINLANIHSIEISSKPIEPNKETRKLSFLGELESHNIVIRLKNENTLIGLYGIKQKYKNIAFYVDSKIEFKDQVNKALRRLM